MIDCHILIHPDTRADWVTQCLDSVYLAADRAGYPVAVHPVRIADACPQALGHIGRGRAYGYSLGVHPYVTSVDDDDWIEPWAFAALADALDRGVAGLTTEAVMHLHDNEMRNPRWRYAMRAFHRSVVSSAPVAEWRVDDAQQMMEYARSVGEMMHIPREVYHYRLHASPHRALMRSAA